jgi:hypothetical protein
MHHGHFSGMFSVERCVMTKDKDFRKCDECGTVVESGFIDDDGVCDECNEAWSARHEVTEQQEWHDFDPDC